MHTTFSQDISMHQVHSTMQLNYGDMQIGLLSSNFSGQRGFGGEKYDHDIMTKKYMDPIHGYIGLEKL
jgi:hypothetical protein